MKKILCLILAASLLFLAACSGNRNEKENGQTIPGRYVESDITPPTEGRFISFLTLDDVIVCLDEGLKTRYESADGGESWSELPGPGGNTDRYSGVQAGTLLNDGSLLIYMPGEGLVTVAQDGSSKPFPVDEIDKTISGGENVSISLLQAIGNDRILLSYMIGGMMQMSRPKDPSEEDASPDDGAQSADPNAGSGPVTRQGPQTNQGGPQGGTQGPSGGMSINSINFKTLLCDISTGQVVAQLPVESAMAATSDNSTLYVMDNSKSVSCYNLSDGKPSGKPDIRFGGADDKSSPGPMGMRMGGAGGNVLALKGDGGLYAALDGALLLADSGGAITTVLESAAYSIGTPRWSVNSVLALGDGSIVINMFGSGQTSRLYKYVWDEDAAVNPDKTLSVWSLEDNSFARAAIAELRKKHTDAYITYEVALGGNSAMSASDAIKTLNTRLLGGSGPDIILLDGLSADSYADKGMLLDMIGLIDTADVFDSLLEPFSNGGKLYCLPTQFLMPLLMGSDENLQKVRTLDDLVSLAVNGNDLPVTVPGYGPFTGVDEEERAALYFNDLKELCDVLWAACAPDIVSDNRLNTDALRRYLEAVKAISDKYALAQAAGGGSGGMSVGFSDGSLVTAIPGSLMRYTMQTTHYAAFNAGNLQLLQMMIDSNEANLDLFPGLTSGAWQPSTVAAISADTKVPLLAAQLVQAMLSAQVQQLNYGTGLPVTRAGLAAQIDAINDRRAQNGQHPFTFDPNPLIDKLQVPSMGDTALTDMMWNSVEKCCKGQLDVEGAVKEIEQSVKNYLAERS